MRALVAERVPPDEVAWSTASAAGLFAAVVPGLADGENPEPTSTAPLRLPRAVATLIESIVCHRDPERYALLYRLVWRILHGERHLLEVASDPLVHRLELMAKAVRRDIHKMHAFVRFRRTAGEPERYVAFFEPEHFILEAAAPFFVERFRALDWSILTPIGSAHWDGERLAFGPPGSPRRRAGGGRVRSRLARLLREHLQPGPGEPRSHAGAHAEEVLAEPARDRGDPGLVRSAASRVSSMLEQEPTMPTKRTPEKALEAMRDREIKSLAQLNRLLKGSEPLVKGATQAVPGEGPEDAEIVFVGEQPGDQEDLQGRPFVGPAGKVFDRALGDAGLDRDRVYVTNAVKHFKFEQRGKRRIHGKPTAGEVKHYRWWLEKELELVRPKLVVALGGTAVLAHDRQVRSRSSAPAARRISPTAMTATSPSTRPTSCACPTRTRRRRPTAPSSPIWRACAKSPPITRADASRRREAPEPSIPDAQSAIRDPVEPREDAALRCASAGMTCWWPQRQSLTTP